MKPSNLELVQLSNSDWVIMDGHVLLEDAKKWFGDEIRDATGYPIDDVRHSWMRYEFVSQEDLDFDDSKFATWMLHGTKRPKGVVKKCTEII